MQQAMNGGVGRRIVDGIVRMSSTRTNYWAEFAVDASLGCVLLFEGWRHLNSHSLMGVSAFVLGLFGFSFVEYAFHRWLFHTHVPLFSQGHDLHHERPLGYESLPFFLPGAILLLLTGIAVLLLPVGFALIMMAAVTFGYIAYGLSHFTIHRVRFNQPLLRRWAASHHVHHYHPGCNFGVTTPLWDVLLGTRYVRQPRKP